MLNIDLSPLFRSSIGFDTMMDTLDDAFRLGSETSSWPPYNIEKLDEENYRIVLAVAGYGEGDLSIETKENLILITGKRSSAGNATYLYQGIGANEFERRFHLAEHIKVSGANLSNGLLEIHIVREVPEQLKPRKINISHNRSKLLGSEKAA